MTWALLLNGSNQFGTFADVNIPASTPFEIEFGFAFSNSGHGRPFGRNAYNNYNSRCLLFYNTQEVRLTDNSGSHAVFTAPTYTRTDYNIFKFIRDIANTVTCYLNGTPIGTVSNFSGQILFNQTGRHATASYTSAGGLTFFNVAINNVLERDYDADVSDHGAGTPQMVSDVNSDVKYITGQNMPSDGSAWLEFSGGIAPVIPQFSLTGGVTDDSVNIVGRVDTSSTTLVIEYADNVNFANSSTTSVLGVDSDLLVKTTLTGLAANTDYYYRYVDDGAVIADIFEFKTNNLNQQYSFKMGFGGCSRSIASTTWDRLKVRDLDGFIGLGDLPYIDDETVDGLPQKAAYFAWLARADVRSLFDKFSYDYMWDDHDFGENDSIGTNPAKAAQQANYRNIFPNYPLAQASDAIYHAYTRGRVRFIVPDLRSDRGTYASGVMIDAAQMEWIKQEFTDFKAQRDLGNLRAVVLCSSVQWTDNTRSESWSRAPAQRTEITDHIVSLGVESEIIVISSNLHALGADSGANNTYGTGGTGGFPHYCGSAMATDVTTETDTGEYDLGIYGSSNGGNKHQYGVLEFVDSGSDFSIVFTGYNANTDAVLVTHTLVTNEPLVQPPGSYVFYGSISLLSNCSTNFIGEKSSSGILNLLQASNNNIYGFKASSGNLTLGPQSNINLGGFKSSFGELSISNDVSFSVYGTANDIIAKQCAISINAQSSFSLLGYKSAKDKIEINNTFVVNSTGEKTATSIFSLISDCTLYSTGIKYSHNTATINQSCSMLTKGFKTTSGVVSFNSVCSFTVSGTIEDIISRSGAISILAQSQFNALGNKATGSFIQLVNSSNFSAYGEKSVYGVLTLNVDADFNSFGLKSSFGSISLNNAASFYASKYSESYIPVFRKISIDGHIINKITIKGFF